MKTEVKAVVVVVVTGLGLARWLGDRYIYLLGDGDGWQGRSEESKERLSWKRSEPSSLLPLLYIIDLQVYYSHTYIHCWSWYLLLYFVRTLVLDSVQHVSPCPCYCCCRCLVC